MISRIGSLWSQCDIDFVLENYSAPVARDAGVLFNPANLLELDDIRRVFEDGHHALMVSTGTWNRNGTLGYDGSNGFSSMPGGPLQGIVMENWVGTSPLLIAHEAGHLIGGLEHTGDTTNLMNHFITSQTTELSPSQCNYARNTLRKYYSGWLR